jgi:hypothetical protein
LTTQALTLLPALLITQLFYHWKSFLLEFGGFLVTWGIIDFIVTTARDFWRTHRSGGGSNGPGREALEEDPVRAPEQRVVKMSDPARERPRDGRTAKKCDELAPFHLVEAHLGKEA